MRPHSMSLRLTRSVLLLIAMLGSAVVAQLIHPQSQSRQTEIDLEAMIPTSFGAWTISPNVMPVVSDPTTQYYIDKFYAATLGRTYVDTTGRQMMLSIAYGGSQTDSLKVHKPEVCYTAGGFEVLSLDSSRIAIETGDHTTTLPIKRMHAVRQGRHEPVSYWMTVGDKVAITGFEQKLAQLGYGLRGEIPDGLLFRVSSIGTDVEQQYEAQDRFVNDLISAVTPEVRFRLTGLRTN